jgi:hypothetical protein
MRFRFQRMLSVRIAHASPPQISVTYRLVSCRILEIEKR